MLIRAQSGRAYNVSHMTRIEVVQIEQPEEGEKPFEIVAIFAVYDSPRKAGSQVLGGYNTREEADDAIRDIVKSSGGVDLDPLPRKAEAY